MGIEAIRGRVIRWIHSGGGPAAPAAGPWVEDDKPLLSWIRFLYPLTSPIQGKAALAETRAAGVRRDLEPVKTGI